jgi:hypothetical protein
MSMNELIKHQITTITENNKHTLHIDCSLHLDVQVKTTDSFQHYAHIPMSRCLQLVAKVCVKEQSVLLLLKYEM